MIKSFRRILRKAYEAIGAFCKNPRSAKRVHRARKCIAQLEAACADLSSVRSWVYKARGHLSSETDTIKKLCTRSRKQRKSRLKRFIKAARRFRKEPLTLRLEGPESASAAIEQIVSKRYADIAAAAAALPGEDDEALHRFRLTCKRLRYALDRFDVEPPASWCSPAILKQLANDLGDARDCSKLARRSARCGAPGLTIFALGRRSESIARARERWSEAGAAIS